MLLELLILNSLTFGFQLTSMVLLTKLYLRALFLNLSRALLLSTAQRKRKASQFDSGSEW